MTTFDEREDAFERKYAHDAQMQFKAEARRNRMLGEWAAAQMGMSGAEAEAYAKSVVIEDMKEAGDDDVYRKVAADLEAKGLPTDELRAKMDALLIDAKEQVMSEAG